MARVLLINPPIHDFAAYDLCARPLGLLYLAAALERLGHDVRIVDALDRLHPSTRSSVGKHAPRSRRYGTGSYFWREVEKPAVYAHVPRVYKRFGIPEEAFAAALADGPRPDLVGVTSVMTYWYPGVIEAVRAARGAFPGVPVALGGIYATLCADHARETVQPDFLVEGPGEDAFTRIVADVAGGPASEGETPFARLPNPAYHLLPRFESVSVLTGRGCPYSCAYCASRLLAPRLERRDPEAVVDEIASYRARYGTMDVAFFDDALLWDADRHVKPLLEGLVRRGLAMRFHTPNGLHARFVDAGLARLMKEAGFRTIRLSLETVAPAREADWDHKVRHEDFVRAAAHLKAAGFAADDLGAYVMAGIPGESLEESLRAVAAAHAAGVAARLAQYTPIPGTAFFERARATCAVDIAEPLLQNNTVVPVAGEGAFARHEVLKSVVRRLNDALAAGRTLVSARDVEGDIAGALERAGVIGGQRTGV